LRGLWRGPATSAPTMPAYFIVVVGHVLVPIMAAVFFATELSVMTT
jgi:hypothetical protein